MFLIVYGISFPLDEGVAHSLSIAGTLLYVLSLSIVSSKPLKVKSAQEDMLFLRYFKFEN